MATTDLYTNEMIADLMLKIDEVVATVEQQITELQSINLGVSQSVTVVNCKVGTSKIKALNNSAKTVAVGTGFTRVFDITAAARGTAKLKFTASSPTRTGTFAYSVDGTNWVQLGSSMTVAPGGTAVAFDVPFDVKALYIGCKFNIADNITITANSVSLEYDVVDVVNGTPFAFV